MYELILCYYCAQLCCVGFFLFPGCSSSLLEQSIPVQLDCILIVRNPVIYISRQILNLNPNRKLTLKLDFMKLKLKIAV